MWLHFLVFFYIYKYLCNIYFTLDITSYILYINSFILMLFFNNNNN